MTTIAPVTSQATAATSASASATAGLADNFETFLTLLTAQLQNQDPLSPMDTQDFTNQLVQFTGVEQQMRTNSLLESLSELTRLNSGGAAVSYLGMDAVANTNLAGLGTEGGAGWTYTLPRGAREVTLRVLDSSNRTVATAQGSVAAGENRFDWDGRNLSGNRLPPGAYRLQVDATGPDGRPMTASISQTGTIDSVNMAGTTATVRLAGADIPLSAITRITRPTAQ